MTDQPRDLDAEQVLDALKKTKLPDPPKLVEDPGLSAEQIAHARTRKLVDELKTGGLAQLTELRDALDDLMRAINAKAGDVEEAVDDLAHTVQAAVSMVAVVRPSIDDQAKAASVGLTPPPGKIITSR
jgi:polyhydroxyalkanoate synthesis regulator phasin